MPQLQKLTPENGHCQTAETQKVPTVGAKWGLFCCNMDNKAWGVGYEMHVPRYSQCMACQQVTCGTGSSANTYLLLKWMYHQRDCWLPHELAMHVWKHAFTMC